MSGFSHVSLEAITAAPSLNRKDIRFVIRIDQLPEIVSGLSGHYSVLQVSKNCLRDYQTVYYDTEALDLYHDHHNGRLNRYKVRYRSYADTGDNFLEIKSRNNKGWTLKERLKLAKAPLPWTEEAAEFVKSRVSASLLQQSLQVSYRRISLMGHCNERVTIDLNLQCSSGALQQAFPELAVIEIKQDAALATPIHALLKALGIREISFSKYCLGIATLYPHVKKNNFRQQLNAIKKLQHDTSFGIIAD